MADPDYLAYAQSMVGTVEGQRALADYLHTGGQNLDPTTQAWCAAFINATLEASGYGGTSSNMAKSFLDYGEQVGIDQIRPGDIAVYGRGDPKGMYGHAGFVKSYDPITGKVTLISGNSGAGSNAVAEQTYDASQALGFRRPIERAKEQAAQMAAQGYSPEQIQRAFLDTIAGTESAGNYGVIYGGQEFTDFSHHPGIDVPITSGPNKGKTSSAAGRYQFIKPTWDAQVAKYGYKDFQPATQDKAAWQYAVDVFKEKTGGDLEKALASGDPGQLNAVSQVLSPIWTSLSGGIEQAKKYGTKTFADVYKEHLGGKVSPVPAAGAGGTAPAAGGAGGGGGGAAAPFTPAAAGAEKGDSFESQFGAAVKGMAGKAPALPSGSQVPQLPAGYDLPAGATPTVNAQMAEVQRQRLAEAMARLNSGQLWMG